MNESINLSFWFIIIIINFWFFFLCCSVISIMSSFQFDWPDLSRAAMSWTWFANFNSDNLASDCTFRLSYHEKYIFVIFLPLIVMAMICLRWLLTVTVHKIATKTEKKWQEWIPSLFDTVDNNGFVASMSNPSCCCFSLPLTHGSPLFP
jgi:hypothetical protein